MSEKKISFWRVLSNNWYVLKLIHTAAPGKIISDIMPSILGSTVNIVSYYILRYVLNGVDTGIEFDMVMIGLIGMFAVPTIYYAICNIVFTWLDPYLEYKLKYYLKKMTFDKSRACELACYEDPEFYNKYTLAMKECEERTQSVMSNMSGILYFLISVVGLGALTIMVDPILFIFILVPPILAKLVKKANLTRYEMDQELVAANRVKAYAKRTFFWKDYAAEMKITNMHRVISRQFTKAVEDTVKVYKERGLKLALLQCSASILSEVFCNYLILLYVAWKTLVTGEMMIGDCLIIVGVISRLYSEMRALISVCMDFYSNALYIDNLRYFMDYEPSIKVNDDAMDAKVGDLKLMNVSFQYSGSEKETLKDVSLHIKKGEKIAIVGHNGAGKTTLVKLLLRLYDPTEGAITMGGTDIKNLHLQQYRDLFGTVLQDYKQMSMTVKENVLLRHERVGDDEVVTDALKHSGIYDKVQNLSKGIDTVIGREFDDDGIGLSGGESQKIALAHVYASGCEVVILDEPSSALDPIAEHEMYENMMKVCKDKTVIVISHRLSSAVDADRIYLMEQGCVRESGSHKDLMNKQGVYAQMFNRQAENYRGGECSEKQGA